MDADCKEDKRKRYLESRKQRWSMNSQRLEEIVAELMRPIGDLRHSFNTDLSALLEEYLTEAGLHALDACDSDAEEGELSGGLPPHAQPHVAPNFVELALLLQQSASIYGRKVDFLYQHVLSVSDSLQSSSLLELTNQSQEEDPGGGGAPETPSRRRHVASEWASIELETAPGASRDASEPPRPPPTLPRAYIELEPRVLAPGDAPLIDYSGEPAGLLPDLHVTWRLHEGMLVEELEGIAPSTTLRAIPLTELQAALNARVTPFPPSTPPPMSPRPERASTPLPADSVEDPADASQQMPPPDKCRRKRKREPQPEDLPSRIKLRISKKLRRELCREREFSLPFWWVHDEVQRRRARVLALRRDCTSPPPEFRGFEYSSCDADGFRGWSSAEAACATEAANETRLHDPYSDDDGFFEQSSSGDSDEPSHHHNSSAESGVEWWSWQAAVAARATAAEARGGVDVRALARSVLAALPSSPHTASCTEVIAATAKEPTDVSRMFLATLFLANAGNVEVIHGAPLTTDSFSLRLLTTDERLYSTIAAQDAELLQPSGATTVDRASKASAISSRTSTSADSAISVVKAVETTPVSARKRTIANTSVVNASVDRKRDVDR